MWTDRAAAVQRHVIARVTWSPNREAARRTFQWGVAVGREGAPKPDISTLQQSSVTLLAAKSNFYPDASSGSPPGLASPRDVVKKARHRREQNAAEIKPPRRAAGAM